MNWGSLDAFLSMNGYGLYVWGSYAMCALCVVIELFTLRSRRRTALAELARLRRQNPSHQAPGVEATP